MSARLVSIQETLCLGAITAVAFRLVRERTGSTAMMGALPKRSLMLAVQYLEPGPDAAKLEPAEARRTLQAAFDRLPISCVILGWSLPQALVDACAQETARAGAQLFLWYPLLAGQSGFVPRREWQAVGPEGEPVPAFRGLPEFAFLCPNRPAAKEAALERFLQALRGGPYHGVFLDRIRYPSPAADPRRYLACFCPDCWHAAGREGLDLEQARRGIGVLTDSPEGLRAFVHILLDPRADVPLEKDLESFRRFLEFRMRSVTGFVQAASDIARRAGLDVGLDCFSPALAPMVGQDLAALNSCASWIKIMVYGHSLGPAGIPFELLALANWAGTWGAARPEEVLDWLGQATQLELPADLEALRQRGLPPEALAGEVRRGCASVIRRLLAGIELVDVEGVTRLHHNQIVADLCAVRGAKPDGLVISWDLRRIRPERLDTVRSTWLG